MRFDYNAEMNYILVDAN